MLEPLRPCAVLQGPIREWAGRRCDQSICALQARARDLGWSWQEIARELHVSKQAVHKKHAERRILRRGN